MAKYTIEIRAALDTSLREAWKACSSGDDWAQTFEDYLGERLETEAATYRLEKISEDALQTNRKALSAERKIRPRLSHDMRARLADAYEEGTSIPSLCLRFAKSQPVIYRELKQLGVYKSRYKSRKRRAS